MTAVALARSILSADFARLGEQVAEAGRLYELSGGARRRAQPLQRQLSHAQTQNDVIQALINTYKAMGGAG